MKQKNYFNDARRSRWLPTLVMLLAMFAGGVSPAWAQKTLPYSYGFEDNSLATSGWTKAGNTNNSSSSIGSSYAKTGSYGFRFYYDNNTSDVNPQCLISPILDINSNASNIKVSFYYKTAGSYGPETFKVGYSTTDTSVSSFTWDETVSTSVTEWTQYETPASVSIPVGAKYIAIAYTATNKYYLYIDDINITCDIEGPALGVYDGETGITSGYNYNFGLATSGTSKVFTLKNPGTEPASVSVSHSSSFGATLSSTSIPAGESVTLTVTMPDATGDDVITISSTSDAIDDFVINVSGTVRDPNKVYLDFSNGLIPDGWTSVAIGSYASSYGTAWAASTGYISQSGSSSTYAWAFTSPKLNFTNGEKVFFETAKYGDSGYSSPSITVEYTTDATGATGWTAIGSAFTDDTYGNWTSRSVTIPVEGVKRIRFNGWYVHMRNIYGGEEPNEPNMVVTQPTTLGFGLYDKDASPAPTKTFTIANTGKAVLNGISVTSGNAAFTITGAPASLAAGEDAEVTITMSTATAGALSSLITVSATDMEDASFTVTGTVKPAGMPVEEFTDGLPANWTNASWTFANGEATGKSYSAYLTTPKLVFNTGDFVIIKIKNYDSDGTNYITVQGSSDNGSTWTEYNNKIFSTNFLSNSSWTNLVLSDIPTTVNKLRFVGNYCVVDEIHGLNYAPVLAVTKDETPVSSPAAYDFGEQAANASVTYNFANAGAGTLSVTNVAVTNTPDDGTYTTNWTESVATPFDLVITQNYDAEKAGAKTGSVVVTMSDASTFTINLSGTLLAANAPTLAVDNTLEFGKLTTNDTQTVTVTNSGTGSMTVDIVSDNALFTVSPAQLTEIGAGASKTFDVTFHYDQVTAGNYGVKNANITVTPTYNAEAAIVISASAKAKDPEEWGEDFAGNAKPDGWEVVGSGWTFTDGVARGSYVSNSYLYTPSLSVEAGQSLSFKAKACSYNTDIKVYYSKDGGDYISCISQNRNSQDEYETYEIENLETGNYVLRFTADNYDLDNIEGFKLNADAPAFGYYTNSECTAAAAATVTRNYGFVTEAPAAVVYYMKNDGTGTLNLTLGDVPTGFTAALGETSLAAGESTTLTINMPIATKGYRGGDIVVTGKDGGDNTLGTFTVTASGVVEEDGKMNLNFTQNSTELPVNWENKWSKNGDGYPRAGYSKVTMETGKLVAEANEKIVIVAKNESYSDVFGLNYRAVGDEDWTVLIAEAAIGTDWNTLTATIPAAGNYQLQFVGKGALIQRIYGLAMPQEPVMTVYDGENVAGATKNFGMVSDEADAVWTLTVKNEGQAKLEGLTAELSGEQAAHYSAEITGATGDGNDEIEAGAQATITVKQLKGNLGAHEATLTISATGLDSKVITLSGSTRDASKLYVDFADNTLPDGWKAESDWTIYSNYARQSNETTASSLFTVPVTVAEGQAFSFKAKRNNTSKKAELTVRYTTNGGVTWTEYDWNEYSWKEEGISDQITGTAQTFEVTGLAAGTTVFEFYGKNLQIDDIQANYAMTSAPVFAMTEESNAVANNSTKEFGNLTAAGVATYTLTNNGNTDMVSIVTTTGVATAEISGAAEGVTINDNKVTLAAGKSATITLTVPFVAPYGAKAGAMTIETEGWVADMTVNYTATTIDPDAINVDFASLPAGWYNDGWMVDGTAHVISGTDKELISEQYGAESGKNVLSFEAKAYSGTESQTLNVYTSTDRKTWSEAQTFTLTGTSQSFNLTALADGNYYVKFVSGNASIDNLVGLKKLAAPEHDLYVSTSNIPTDTKVPGTEITATATVNSLRADETGVYAKLFFGDEEVATADAQDISLNGSANFTLTGNVPAAEGTYAAKVVVYYSNNNNAFETAATDVKVEHTRTLAIQSFDRDGEGAMDADANNQISPSFKVTVKNTGTTALTPIIKVKQGETVVGTATGTELAADATSEEITVAATNMSAGEGGELSFTAEAYWSSEDGATAFAFETPVAITVKAAAPKFELAEGSTALNDGDAVAFGLTKSTVVKTYTISNTGNNTLEVSAISAPEGFEAAYAEKNRDDAEWMLYLYKSDDVKDDVATFKQTGVANQFYVENVEITSDYASGTNFCVRNSDWSTKYGWKDGNTVTETGKAFELATAEGATGWMTLAAGTYNVIFDASNLTITFQPQTTKAIFAGESRDVNVTLKAEQGKVSGNLAFTYKVDATNNATFTLALSGRSVAADTWTEDFATGIPATWQNSGWTAEGGQAYSGPYAGSFSLITPRLAAKENEVLTYDTQWKYDGDDMTVEYSTDKNTWTSYATITANTETVEREFVAPADGDYYIRFTANRYVYLDNFVGFTLNIPEHDTEIAAASIPTTGTQYGTYTATVTLKENAGKAEKVTATLYVDNVEKAAETETITANGSTVVTVTWKPDAVITDAVEAYIQVTADGINLATDKVNLTIAAPFTLSDTEAPTFAEATTTYEALVLNREFVEGWNTVCLPFAITDIEEFFGAGAKAYTLNSYVAAENTLKFESATTMNASYPYVVYVPAAIASGKVVENVEIGSQYDTPSTTATYFVGTYAPIDDMSGKWGIGTAQDGNAKIMKGGTNAKMKGFRAYFALPGNTQGAPTMMFDEEVITGISAIEMAAEEGERIYNLNGQRVMNPKKGQMYIVNGKKVAIK